MLKEDYDQKRNALKLRLTAFQQTRAGVPESIPEKTVILQEQDIPFSSSAGAFLFSEVLGFEMHVKNWKFL